MLALSLADELVGAVKRNITNIWSPHEQGGLEDARGEYINVYAFSSVAADHCSSEGSNAWPAAPERVTVKLPGGFDLSRYSEALEKKVTDKHRCAFEIYSLSDAVASPPGG